MQREVTVVKLDVPVRGPGGHWNYYHAYYSDDARIDAPSCFGQTEFEARYSLINGTKKSDAQG